MTEQIESSEVKQPVFRQPPPQIEIYKRNVRTMSPRQLLAHTARQGRRTDTGLIDQAIAIICREVYANTSKQLVDDKGRTMKTELEKNFGRLSPGLR